MVSLWREYPGLARWANVSNHKHPSKLKTESQKQVRVMQLLVLKMVGTPEAKKCSWPWEAERRKRFSGRASERNTAMPTP